MATIYDAKIISHWCSYTKKELEKLLEDAINEKERKKGNVIKIEVTSRNLP